MNRVSRLSLILLCMVVAVLFLLPTVKWYFYTTPEMQTLANGTTDSIREYAEHKAGEGLDQLVALTDTDEGLDGALPEDLAFLIDDAKANYKLIGEKVPRDWTVRNTLSAFGSGQDVYRALEDSYRQDAQDLKDMKDKAIKLGLDLFGGLSVVIEADEESLTERLGHVPSEDELSDALSRAMEILNNRIDTFGVTEPSIRKVASDNQILIEVPGEVDPEQVNSFLMGKGSLAFHIIDEEATDTVLAYTSAGGQIVDGRPVDDTLIAKGLVVRGYYKKDSYGQDVFQRYAVMTAEVGLDGEHIESATVTSDQITGQPNVVFYLDKDGGELFYKLTSSNVNKPMAVVMDDKIKSIANISEGIRDSVRVTGFNTQEANDLALILRTAAMPVDLEVKSQSIVGATLGEETRNAGLMAIAIGFGAVFLFMLIWYRRAGFVADVALLLNLFFITAVLSAFRFTLTMTSIAGLILNVGMAVDANVIIFERIKEELRLGKSRSAAIEGGFRKAFWTIMDANITTLIAALFLSMLGSGSVRGFAVTLAVGIVSSLFTALFVSHFLFDVGTENLKQDKIKIGWGLK
ncbi:MAG: protein translocase subunit SecD [Spirochaetales bacterium]|nr:protein translocase subunit SecD [Spirochaetales bacterium]